MEESGPSDTTNVSLKDDNEDLEFEENMELKCENDASPRMSVMSLILLTLGLGG